VLPCPMESAPLLATWLELVLGRFMWRRLGAVPVRRRRRKRTRSCAGSCADSSTPPSTCVSTSSAAAALAAVSAAVPAVRAGNPPVVARRTSPASLVRPHAHTAAACTRVLLGSSILFEYFFYYSSTRYFLFPVANFNSVSLFTRRKL